MQRDRERHPPLPRRNRAPNKGNVIVHRTKVASTGITAFLSMLATPAMAMTPATDNEPQDTKSSEIVVLGNRGKDYKVDELTTATRTGTDLMDVPQSIQVVTRDVIDDQQTIDLTSALLNVSGIQPGTTAG